MRTMHRRFRRTLLTAGPAMVLACSLSARAEDTLTTFAWPDLETAGRLIQGTVLYDDAGEAFLRLTGSEEEGTGLAVLKIDDPGITKTRYAITGEVRYKEVEGEGYLEMWNHFGGGERYFTRTLSTFGPFKHLAGSSDWRPFELPFISNAGLFPEKLEVNVVLPGPGQVDLRGVRLMQYDGRGALAMGGGGDAWWGPRGTAIIGGVGGSLVGILFALVGVLTHQGRGGSFLSGLLLGMHVAGDVSILAGVVAILRGQPYGVYYPLLLLGLLVSILSLVQRRRSRDLLGQREMRRVQALDAG